MTVFKSCLLGHFRLAPSPGCDLKREVSIRASSSPNPVETAEEFNEETDEQGRDNFQTDGIPSFLKR